MLAEKRKLGAEARFVRAMRRTKKTWSANGGAKRQTSDKIISEEKDN